MRYSWLAVILIPLCAFGDASPTTLMHRIDAGNFDSSGWALAESTNGNFSVRMPGPFNDFSVTGDSSGIADTIEGIGGKAPNGLVFTAMKLLYNAKGMAATEYQRQKSGEGLPSPTIKSAPFNGYESLDIVYFDGGVETHERVIDAGETLFTLTVQSPAAKASSAEALFEPFVASFKVLPDAAPRVENPTIWQHSELNQAYMRTLTKDACIKKTVATLSRSGCATKQCLASVGGATGDCITWASGDTAQFCATYESRYIDKNCGPGGLDIGRCSLLRVVKAGVCDKPPAK